MPDQQPPSDTDHVGNGPVRTYSDSHKPQNDSNNDHVGTGPIRTYSDWHPQNH